jgi:rubrerythrin
MPTDDINKLLDFAISEEQAAADFYKALAGKMDAAWMKQVFESFSKEELGHKAKLEKIKGGATPFEKKAEVPDLKIGDYLVEGEASADMDYQDALIIAMKKEKAAFKMYSDMAQATTDDGIRDVLLSLAQEEAKHKLRFEVEYDEQILTEN